MLSNWIWTQEWEGKDENTPRMVYFRKRFVLEKEPEAARIEISADTKYKLYVNERFVEIGPSRGDREVWFADTVNLLPFLHKGENVMAVIVLRYPVRREEGNHGMFRTEIPGLYVRGEVKTGQGNSLDISADESWKTYTDRETRFVKEEEGFAPLMIHEEAAGSPVFSCWKKVAWDDSNWMKAVCYPRALFHGTVSPGNLNPRTIAFMYRKKRSFAGIMESNGLQKKMTAGKTLWMVPARSVMRAVLDAGEEMTGYLSLALAGGKGAKVTLLEAECFVQSEKSPTCGVPVKGDRLDWAQGHLEGYRDIYRVAGIGTAREPEVYEPFWYRTFRLIEVTIQTMDEPLTVLRMNYEETGYPLDVRTHVETSDSTLKEIWDISERTLRRCMHESYEDCPFYEQLQYTMDTRAQILYTYSVAADDRLARKAIDDFSRAQRSGGLLNCSYPNMNPNVIPGFSIYYILMLYDHMMYFGDKKLLLRYLPTADKILNYFDRHLTPEGLVDKVGGVLGETPYWSFIDWAAEWNPTSGMPPCGLHGPITMESLLYVYGLQKAAEVTRFVGRTDTANEYAARAKAVQRAVRTYCRRPDGMITDGPGSTDISQHGQVFGILTGTLDQSAGRVNILRTMEEPGCPQCTVAMCFYLFRALEKCGLYEYTDRYWNIWRKMVRLGCTTSIESEDYSRSECHAWGALALYELPSAILGVRPAAPGYRKMEIRPHTEYLDYALGSVFTPVGEVKVSWDKRDGELKMKAVTPEGIDYVM